MLVGVGDWFDPLIGAMDRLVSGWRIYLFDVKVHCVLVVLLHMIFLEAVGGRVEICGGELLTVGR